MSRTSLGVLGFVCLLIAGQASAGDAELLDKLLIRASENAAKGVAMGSIRFENEPADPILSFSWGVTQTGSVGGGGGGAGKATISPFSFVKRISKSSPGLFQACAQGKHFKEVTIEARNDKGQKYLEIKLSDVLITSYQLGGSSEDDLMDSLSIVAVNAEYILIGL